MPFNHEKDQLELAKYLPAPLFTLFSETRAYSQACGKFFDTFYFFLIRELCMFLSQLSGDMAWTYELFKVPIWMGPWSKPHKSALEIIEK